MPKTNAGGIASIDMDMSVAFLAQRLGRYLADDTIGKHKSAYAKLLSVFELLCNLNFRDREIASEILCSNLRVSLRDLYPNLESAIDYWANGDLIKARERFSKHLILFPCDIVVSFMLHMFDFLHGYSSRYNEYLFKDARCVAPELGGYYQGILAFALCEQGRYIEALPIALEAHEKNKDDVYSLHALIHAWHGLGHHDIIVRHLKQVDSWKNNSGMNMHVNWHLSVSLLEIGASSESVVAYREFRSLAAGHDAEQDLDAVNYCIRIYCYQLSRPSFSSEYSLLARNWAASIYNSLSYFNDVHAAIAFMLAGDSTLLKKLKHRPPIRVLDKELQDVGSKLISAVVAFADEDYAACVNYLESSQHLWHRIGGSRAQREILEVLHGTALRLVSANYLETRKSEIIAN